MTCECLTKLDEKLKPLNGQVARRFCIHSTGATASINDSVLLTVEKIVPRGKKPPGVLAKFCPFCGTAYSPVETKPLDPEAPTSPGLDRRGEDEGGAR